VVTVSTKWSVAASACLGRCALRCRPMPCPVRLTACGFSCAQGGVAEQAMASATTLVNWPSRAVVTTVESPSARRCHGLGRASSAVVRFQFDSSGKTQVRRRSGQRVSRPELATLSLSGSVRLAMMPATAPDACQLCLPYSDLGQEQRPYRLGEAARQPEPLRCRIVSGVPPRLRSVETRRDDCA
jgi:hypothetical protein